MTDTPPSPVILVLGAGASIPYGYPSGRDLIFEIIEGLSRPQNSLAAMLQNCGHEWQLLNEFREDLRKSNLLSLDTFLDRRRLYRECGKQAIAACLMPKEKHGSVWRSREQKWYEYLFNKVHPWIVSSPDALRIISFNYDRSLEFSLLHGFLSGLGMTEVKAKGALDRMWILHVHGQLGGIHERPYASSVNAAAVCDVAKDIKLVGDDDTGNVKTSLAEWIRDSSNICFLGFGFHADNVNMLSLPQHMAPTARAYSTGIGLEDGERRQASTTIGRTIEFGANVRTCDCEWLLRHFGILTTR